MVGGYALERSGGTCCRYRTFVAIDAAVVTDLQEERTIAERVTTLDTFAAAVAELFVDGVFVVGLFDILSAYRPGGA
jgi:hypothetical protein